MSTTQDYPDMVADIYAFLSNMLYPAVESGHVFYGNQNNITLPDDNDYCIFYLSGLNRTSTTLEEYDADNEQLTLRGKADMACRVDIYCSSQNGDTNITALQRAENLAILFKSSEGVYQFKDSGLTPLYADEPSDTSLPNSDSGNYLFRATVTLHFYVNHSLTIDKYGFNTVPTIVLNSFRDPDEAEGDELHISHLDTKFKEE